MGHIWHPNGLTKHIESIMQVEKICFDYALPPYYPP
jgi:hypothetical protein